MEEYVIEIIIDGKHDSYLPQVFHNQENAETFARWLKMEEYDYEGCELKVWNVA